MRVAIVGCGITGAAAAYFLSEQGHEVEIFEKNSTFGGNVLKSSALVWGIKTSPFSEEWGIEAACIHLTHKLILEMVAEWKENIQFEPLQTLSVIHTEEEWNQAKEDCKNIPIAKLISLEEGLKINPHFSKKLKGFVLWSKAYAADPFLTVQAIVKKAKSHGANFKFLTEVVRISKSGEVTWKDVSTPKAPRKKSHYDKIILANGCYTSKLTEQVGVHIPVFPVHGQMFTIRPPEGFTLNCILSSWEKRTTLQKIGGLNVTHEFFGAKRRFRHLYGRQRTLNSGKPGPLIFGGDRIIGDVGFDNEDGHDSVRKHITQIFPILGKDFKYRGKWFGVMPWTPDELPVIGEITPNIWVASGLQAHGFGLGLGAAQLLVEKMNGIHRPVMKEADPHRFRQSSAKL